MPDSVRATPEVVRGPIRPKDEMPSPHPVRLLGVDVARGVALILLLLVETGYGLCGPSPDGGGLHDHLHGRAAAGFVILAGVGMSLLSAVARRHRRPADLVFVKQRLRRRGWSLLLFGLALMALWPRDALHFLGVFSLLGILTFQVPDRRLLWLALGSAALFPTLAAIFGHREGWEMQTLSYKDQWTLVGSLRHLVYNGPYAVLPWMAFAFAGMWIGRLDLTAPRIAGRLALGGLLAALAAELLSRPLVAAARGADMPNTAALLQTDPIPPGPLFLLASGGAAVFVLGIILLLSQRAKAARWLEPVGAVGRMALTTYVVMALALASARILHPEPFAERTALFAGVASAVFALFVLPLAQSAFGQGPLERLLRAWEGRDEADDPSRAAP